MSIQDMDFGFDDVQSGDKHESTLWSPIDPAQKTSPNTPEKTVRPWESYRERRDQRLAQLRQFPQVEPIAQACWGGTTDFDEVDTLNPNIGGGFNTRKRDDDDTSEEDDPSEQWQEVARESRKIRVASEDDPEVFVDILVAEESTLQIPSLTISKVVHGQAPNGSARSTTTTMTIPGRLVRVKWMGVSVQQQAANS